MTREESGAFSNQVLEVINRQHGDENFPYYGHFLADCRRFDLSEDQFKKQILVQAFKNYAGHIEPTTGAHVTLFGIKCYSLMKFGQVLYDNPVKSEVYLEDAILFKEDIRKVISSDQTLELVSLLKSEQNLNRRFLRVCYRLNTALPFRIANQPFESLDALMAQAFQDHSFYERVVSEFMLGYLQIWIQETNSHLAAKLPQGQEYNDFLAFIYKVDSSYPIYFGQRLVQSPAELARLIQEDWHFLNSFYLYIKNKQLSVWLTAIGHMDWNEKLHDALANISGFSLYESKDKKQAAVLQLARIIDPNIPTPKLASQNDRVSLLQIEAATITQHQIVVQLQHTGIVKCEVRLKEAVPGVVINPNIIHLNNYQQINNMPITMTIDPMQMVKGQVYCTDLLITSLESELAIPVELQSVFPKKAFIISLAKYGLFGSLFFGFIRWLLAIATGISTVLPPMIITQNVSRSLPGNYLAFYLVFIAMLISGTAAFFTIKKMEKI